jgi:hypothetical protein
MSSSILSLNLITQSFITDKLELTSTGFILRYDNQNYIITVHHFLPINKIHNNNDELEIIFNSTWNELLICNCNNIDLSKYIIYNKIKNKIPKMGDILSFIPNKKDILSDESLLEKIELRFIGYDFLPFDNINSDILIPYIKALCTNNAYNFAGLSGSPIFINNTIIGIFSKYNIKESILYIIPIYIFIKTINKIDQNNIYTMASDKIKKINSYNVKNNKIYHPTLKINVPINTFFLIEGDINYVPIISYNNVFSSPDNTRKYKSTDQLVVKYLQISNEINIVTRNLDYKITSRLLSLLNKLIPNKNIIRNLFQDINEYSDTTISMWITLVDNKIEIII